MIDLAATPDFRIGEVAIRPRAREIAGPAGCETVEPRVMEVLVTLARANGAVVTHQELADQCWGGRIVGEDAIQRVMARIRRLSRTIATDSFRLETVVKVGYRLIDLKPATPSSADPNPAPAGREPGSGDPPRPVARTRPRHWWLAAALVAIVAAGVIAFVLRADRRAAEASRSAAARTDDLRGLATFTLGELNGELARVAGNTRARVRLADRAHRYLVALAALPNAAPQVKLDTARGLVVLARAQGVPGQPNLGQRDRARANIRRAMAILEPLPASSAARAAELADATAALAMVQAHGDTDVKGAAASLRRAEATLASVPATARDDRWHEARRQVRFAQTEVAVLNQSPAELLRLTDLMAADLAARPTAMRRSREAALDAARIVHLRGLHAYFLDDMERAVTLVQRAQAMFGAADRELPDDPLTLYAMMWNHYIGFGAAVSLPGRTALADEFLNRAVQIGDRLMRLEANDTSIRAFAGNLRQAQSQALSAAGDHRAAIASQRSAVALYRDLLGPDRAASTMNRLVKAQVVMANVSRAAADRAATCEAYRAARDHMAELERRDGLIGSVAVHRPALDANLARCAAGAPLSAMAEL